jgi:hypothetical protein
VSAWRPVLLALIAATVLSTAAARTAEQGVDGIDLEITDTTVPAVIGILRTTHCAAVSFIQAPGDQRVTLALRKASMDRVLRELATQQPAYRYEMIAGHHVLYPASPEFQAVVRGVQIKDMERFPAADKYLLSLRKAVPALARLAGPPRCSPGRSR